MTYALFVAFSLIAFVVAAGSLLSALATRPPRGRTPPPPPARTRTPTGAPRTGRTPPGRTPGRRDRGAPRR